MVRFVNTTESMIKVWIAADYLRRQQAPGAGALAELNRMIVDSDDNVAIKYYMINGGDASVRQLITLCQLHGSFNLRIEAAVIFPR